MAPAGEMVEGVVDAVNGAVPQRPPTTNAAVAEAPAHTRVDRTQPAMTTLEEHRVAADGGDGAASAVDRKRGGDVGATSRHVVATAEAEVVAIDGDDGGAMDAVNQVPVGDRPGVCVVNHR